MKKSEFKRKKSQNKDLLKEASSSRGYVKILALLARSEK